MCPFQLRLVYIFVLLENIRLQRSWRRDNDDDDDNMTRRAAVVQRAEVQSQSHSKLNR